MHGRKNVKNIKGPFICLFICLFICCLFNDIVSHNLERQIIGWLINDEFYNNCNGIFQYKPSELTWMDLWTLRRIHAKRSISTRISSKHRTEYRCIYFVSAFYTKMGVKLGRWHWGTNVGWGCLRIGCWGEYLGLRGTR